ncbi:sensor histidine kinase [Chengkuizengella axinellae]|uniref:histidine kinase n=1 Tax=Chengkuizengella axinellae TaxID=3064388 RepID=A0ABT9IVL2_9BACL|nr:sensor histidine kinase [Chengkuizengella sp. 2205SS18-9]MDP5272820.1 ATP-binding protein [Chengkuizengella sp. 2205SS18-9]
MLYVLFALWGIAIILLRFDYKNRSIRWLSGLLFCGGCGAIAILIGEHLLPFMKEHSYSFVLQSILYRIQVTCSGFSYYGIPYCYILFSLYYHPKFINKRWFKFVPYVLSLPIVLMLLFTPVYPVTDVELYPVLASWSVVYVILGSILILTKREELPNLKRNHILTSLSIVPTVLFVLVMNYVLPSFEIYRMWKYNTWIVIYGSLVFMLAIFNYGFLGMQLLIERKKLDITLQAITSGTAILNHAIKNDAGKMRLFGHKIKSYAQSTEQKELEEDIEVILKATSHIQQMIQKVQHQTHDIILKKGNHNLKEMVEESIKHAQPYLKHIRVIHSVDESINMICDKTHVMESIYNVVMNAIEAMPEDGELELIGYETNQHHILEIIDTGYGINSNHLKKVMDPFFTTKTKDTMNFGLGLAYVYNVMNRHGGSLDIKSKRDEGTTVILKFPKVKVKNESY